MKPCLPIIMLLLGLATFTQAEELLRNPDFAQEFDKVTNWQPILHKEYRDAKATPATIIRQGNKAFVQAEVDIKSASHYYNIQQEVDCSSNKTYRLTFEARTLGTGFIRVSLHDPATRRNAGMAYNPPTDKSWKRFECIFTPTKASESEEQTLVVGFGSTTGISHVRNFSLTEVGTAKRSYKEIPLPGAAAAVDLSELMTEFKTDAATAAAKYKEKPVQISSLVSSVTRGPRAGLYMFTLEFGKVKLVGNGAELGPETLKELAAALKSANAKVGAMKRSPKWGSFSPEVREEHMRSAYPTLHAGAFITGYKDGVLQCGRSQELALDLP